MQGIANDLSLLSSAIEHRLLEFCVGMQTIPLLETTASMVISTRLLAALLVTFQSQTVIKNKAMFAETLFAL